MPSDASASGPAPADEPIPGPAAPAPARTTGTGSTGVGRPLGAVLFVAAVVVPLLRERGVPTWDTIWVEDAPVFIEQANASGPFAVLGQGYAGYWQLVTRVLALPTASIPAPYLALYVTVISALVVALLAAFVYRCTDGWIASAPVRVLVAAMVAVSPAMAIETTATITNLIWPLLAVAPWALLSRRAGRVDVVLRGVMLFLVATATALSFLFVPLAVAVAVVRRTRATYAVVAAFGIGLVAQAAVVLRSSPPGRTDTSVRLLADLFGLRVLGSFLLGERPLDQLWTDVGEVVVPALVVVTVVIFALAFRGAGRHNQWFAAVMLGYAVIGFVVPVVGRGTAVIGFDLGVYTLNMTRFTIAPILCLVSAAAVLLDPIGAPGRRRVAERGRPVLLVWGALVLLVGLPASTVRGAGPGWRDELDRVARTQCAGAPDDSVVRVTTTPDNFSVALRCDRVRG